MIATSTLTTIVLAALGLCALWIAVIIFRRDNSTLPRALVVAGLLGIVLFLLDASGLETISFRTVRDRIFPPPPLEYTYEVEDHYSAGGELRYVFTSGMPPLELSLDPTSKYFNLEKIEPLNRVLRDLGLPEVTHGVPELSAVTGSMRNAEVYEWDDYAKGLLRVYRTIYQSKDSLQSYHGINVISIRRK